MALAAVLFLAFVGQASSFSTKRSPFNHQVKTFAVEERIKGWYQTRIQQQIREEDILAVRVSHALFSTYELAKTCLEKVKEGADFESLVRSVSACDQTREEGGMIGWVGINDSHLDDLLPREAREASLNQKPGDVILCSTARGTHLLKIVDIMTRIQAKTTKTGVRKLKGSGFELPSLADQLSGMPGVQPTYYFETMGCQMNVADTER
jgi:hypothetical protein